ncbi:MAG TPA: hypothetical protein DCG57_04005, partial [Candidatus Riflebacteria bacterium]|nr:hypothetical protein [Candidatus Riflebacteria bacterium]
TSPLSKMYFQISGHCEENVSSTKRYGEDGHWRAIPVAQIHKAIHGQKASSELIPLSMRLLRWADAPSQ